MTASGKLESSHPFRTRSVDIAAASDLRPMARSVPAFSPFGTTTSMQRCAAGPRMMNLRVSFATWSARKKSATILANQTLFMPRELWSILAVSGSLDELPASGPAARVKHLHYCFHECDLWD